MPWEERRIADVPFFSSFAGRVHAALGGQLHHRSLVLDQLWPHAVTYISDNLRHPFSDEPASAALARCRLGLGETLARARHAVEREAGLTTREHPLGLACWFDPFKPFAAHLFSRAVEFHHVYNQALAEYRAASHVRSKTHPVPDLVRKGEWLEMPFWMWTEPDRTDNHPQRQRVFVRARGKSWELWDGGHLHVSPAATPWTKGVYQWDELGTKLAHKLRPRALITTMYARLVLSDLFIHGIGGARYDEVTDEIIRRFFGIEPPKYITATATFRLPIERPHVTIEDIRDVRQKLREVRYRPETFLRDPLTRQVPGLREQLQALADEKRDYVRTHDLRRCEKADYARLDKLNRAMHDLLQPVERELLAQQSQLSEDLRRAELLGSREFSFVLFPADDLPQRLLALSKVSA
jgi:hypothetical protein